MEKKKGKAARFYSINEDKLKEAIEAVEKLIKSLKEELSIAHQPK